MPLMKASLSQQLESVFARKPQSAAEAAADWAKAYLDYASMAVSSAGSLPVTAAANLGLLQSAFMVAFQAQTSTGAALLITQGVLGFWSTLVWIGITAAGTTTSPGNSALAASLGAIFSDTAKESAADKARQLADAFDVGAKLVIVTDIPFIQPAPPIVGPIS